MRTRCPQCNTVFRITPEQLRARGGRVRCGHCQAIFNALESLVEEPASRPEFRPPPPPPEPEAIGAPESVPTAEDGGAPESAPAAELPPPPEPEPESPVEPEWIPPQTPEPEPEPEPDFEPEAEPEPEPVPEPEPASEARAAEIRPSAAAEHEETPEETTQAARAAGLVAARELTETPGYNRWAAGTLAGVEPEAKSRAAWPFVLAAVLLSIGLLLQVAYHFRTGIVQRLPDAASLFNAFGIDIPLPREADLVSIEASDLQADNARGLLVLQATLKNRAAYAQAWPALELTLTDARDTVVARRVLGASEYLPAKADPSAFAANSEIALRLWIEAKEVAATGYRLYVFYP